MVGALEDPYVAYERGIVSVDWNNWPQVPIAVAKTLQHQFFFLPTSFLSPPMFCGICSYHAHASSSKGSSCARIRKEHNQGIGGCCSIPRNEVYATYPRVLIWNPIFALHCCYPLGLTFFILRKMNARTFNETITASNCTTSLAHSKWRLTQITSLRSAHCTTSIVFYNFTQACKCCNIEDFCQFKK